MAYSNETLVLLPDYDYLTDTSPSFRCKALYEIKKLFSDLEKYTIPFVFSTDDTANAFEDIKCKKLNTLTQRDIFFVNRNCQIPIKMKETVQLMGLKDWVKESEAKYKHKEGASLDSQFEVVKKRDNYVRRSVLKRVRSVVYFNVGGFKLPKVPDSTLVIKVEPSFVRLAYIGGRQVDINKIMA